MASKNGKTTVDMAVIQTRIEYIAKSIDVFTIWAKETDNKIDNQSNKITALEQKVGILATFQATFTVVISAIASFLGVKK
jgi:hypothetical protein